LRCWFVDVFVTFPTVYIYRLLLRLVGLLLHYVRLVVGWFVGLPFTGVVPLPVWLHVCSRTPTFTVTVTPRFDFVYALPHGYVVVVLPITALRLRLVAFVYIALPRCWLPVALLTVCCYPTFVVAVPHTFGCYALLPHVTYGYVYVGHVTV